MKFLFPLAKRFIAGYDFESAKPVIDKLLFDGFQISVDYLGELSKNKNDCEKAYRQYLKIISYYSSRGSKIDLSIKPSQLGLKIDKEYCYKLMQNLVFQASHNRMTVRLDMEDSSVTQGTIDLAIKLRKEFPNIGIALQSNLHRTEKDLSLMMDKEISVRLVNGAYKEHITKAHQDKNTIHDIFVKNALRLLSNRCKSSQISFSPIPAIGTHDEGLISDILSYFNRFIVGHDNVKKNDLFIEMLYGIRRDLSSSLLKQGYCVRIYVPFGEDWLPYTLRRLREFKNMKFVFMNVIKEIWNEKNKGLYNICYI